ncbi:hypothetical protein GOBAR_AA28723 [Gossypium barbadense]|uniref:Thaumatin-like protein n=1 Tax=Gossypium barbadense TaxID=3634 RepID=A0A2P5WLN0_GOSBA|nr:hypothetical protein GOBAR_AA28723 [Gossypium barbadense]
MPVAWLQKEETGKGAEPMPMKKIKKGTKALSTHHIPHMYGGPTPNMLLLIKVKEEFKGKGVSFPMWLSLARLSQSCKLSKVRAPDEDNLLKTICKDVSRVKGGVSSATCGSSMACCIVGKPLEDSKQSGEACANCSQKWAGMKASNYTHETVCAKKKRVTAATFTFVNKCDYTVWPGILANPGSPNLESTGFELRNGGFRSFQAPIGWAGRFWGRTGCSFDDSGHGSCTTGDCGSGEIECNGAGATPPATLAEFTLGSGSQDFYDVSLVDGFNLPMIVEGNGGSGECATTGCMTDLNKKCPSELKFDGGDACKSACDAFGNPEYCCSGAYKVFKSACPKSYSYAFDDATSTFTCTGADYTITFCPNSPSLKSSKDPAAESTGESGPDTDSVQAAALAIFPILL